MKSHYIQPKAVVLSLYKDFDFIPSLMSCSGQITVGIADDEDYPENITPMGKAFYDNEE